MLFTRIAHLLLTFKFTSINIFIYSLYMMISAFAQPSQSLTQTLPHPFFLFHFREQNLPGTSSLYRASLFLSCLGQTGQPIQGIRIHTQATTFGTAQVPILWVLQEDFWVQLQVYRALGITVQISGGILLDGSFSERPQGSKSVASFGLPRKYLYSGTLNPSLKCFLRRSEIYLKF